MIKLNKFFDFRRRKIGMPPGSPIYTGEQGVDEEVLISLLDYDEDRCKELRNISVEDSLKYKDTPARTWINVDGVHNTEVMKQIAQHFDLHPLITEDIMNPNQRAKLDEFEGCLFIVIKMLSYDDGAFEVKGEQVSLMLGENYVISFQEKPGDIFEPLRDRIRSGKGRIRKMGADYLAYSLIDAIVDNYFLILEKFGDRIELLEDSVAVDPSPQNLQEIHHLKRETIYLRKSIWPLREVVNNLERVESGLIRQPTQRYLRDIYDHTIQVMEAVETFREILVALHDSYLSSISFRLNSVMKVLTVIATIFIPLTFIAGIYGMNFKYMPELDWKWGYPFAGIIMLAVVLIMLAIFKRKKWF